MSRKKIVTLCCLFMPAVGGPRRLRWFSGPSHTISKSAIRKGSGLSSRPADAPPLIVGTGLQCSARSLRRLERQVKELGVQPLEACIVAKFEKEKFTELKVVIKEGLDKKELIVKKPLKVLCKRNVHEFGDAVGGDEARAQRVAMKVRGTDGDK
ncbi:hypothetical protein BDK51DRAFT_29328 [Blyttiomyces helicus]|uniref:Uncharacterized protein n=1 Tax=Blyttiomyces helicus TaxID=388810 RepID=A0A4P9WMX7_9FUNG|nr:hypothetical protein BDK51DRAFT_29328 [Blyttiomyces helicus]|eukprot:RKO94284.1 hypothetical protein BDK51DRAFT_29328 [Blyttiomyces helicus]